MILGNRHIYSFHPSILVAADGKKTKNFSIVNIPVCPSQCFGFGSDSAIISIQNISQYTDKSPEDNHFLQLGLWFSW